MISINLFIYVFILLQAVMKYFEDWINSSIQFKVLKRKVAFRPRATDDATAELYLTDEYADRKIIKLLQNNKKVCFCKLC